MYEGFRHVIREHVYDKCWLLDITWAEWSGCSTRATWSSSTCSDGDVKEIRLLLEWVRPLHVVYVVNERLRLVVCRTLYEPDTEHWHPGFRGE